MRVFESIVTGLEDFVCFATAGPGAFDLFSRLGMGLSDSYPILAITEHANRDGSLNETSGLNNFGTRPGPVHIAVPGVMRSSPECSRASIERVRARHKTTPPEFRCFEPSSAQEAARIEERLRSD